MYKEVGKEIKGWAQFIVILHTIPSLLLGIVVFFIGYYIDYAFLGFLIAAAIVAVGYFIARLEQIKLYGYGEMIDRICSLEDHFCKRENVKKVKVDRKAEATERGVPVVHRRKDGSWTCLFCEYENPVNAKWCGNCGVEAEFDKQ